jgi:hypothetical protein
MKQKPNTEKKKSKYQFNQPSTSNHYTALLDEKSEDLQQWS